MEVTYDEKLFLKAFKQALANMKIEEIEFSNEQINDLKEKIKIKLLERNKYNG